MKKSHQNALEEINLKMEDINARLKKSEQQCRSLEENNLELLGKFEKLEEEDRVLNELLRDQFDREGYVRLVISQYNERIELESKISILEEELREKEYGTYDLRGYSGKKICVVGLRSKPTQDKLSEKLKPSKISFIDGNEDGIRQIRDGIENCDVIIYVDAGMKTHVIQQRIDSYVGDRSRMVRIHDTVNYGKILRILQEQNYRFL
jgi:predicted RNase H-like nuclease (RuvC/YqgF family)